MNEPLLKGEVTAAVSFLAILAFFLWLASALSGCGDPQPGYCSGEAADSQQAFIVDGTPSTDERATVRVTFLHWTCTGVLIAPDVVLTAGHCTDRQSIAAVDYRGKRYPSARVLTHPEYVTFPHNDLGLIFLADPVLDAARIVVGVYSPSMAPWCSELIAQGYGRGGTPDEPLREVRYHVWEYSPELLTGEGIPSGGACFGDSGGPLYAVVGGQLLLAGIVSTGFDDACQDGGQFVRADYHWGWIAQEARL